MYIQIHFYIFIQYQCSYLYYQTKLLQLNIFLTPILTKQKRLSITTKLIILTKNHYNLKKCLYIICL